MFTWNDFLWKIFSPKVCLSSQNFVSKVIQFDNYFHIFMRELFSKTFLIVSQLLVQYNLNCAHKCWVKCEFYSHKNLSRHRLFSFAPENGFVELFCQWSCNQCFSSQSQMHEFQWQFQFQCVVERWIKLARWFLSIIKYRLYIVTITVAFVVVIIIVSDTTTIIVDNKSIPLRVKELTIHRYN